MFGDQVEHGVGRAASECDELLAAFAAEIGFKVIRIVFEARDHLAAIASRSAKTRLLRFHDHRAHTALGEM